MSPIFGVSPGGNGDSIVAARNVMSFGAIGDRVTDDTAAIQRGLDAIVNGGSLYIPPGKSFLIKSPNPGAFAPALTLRCAYYCLFGEGPSSEIFVDDTGAAAGGTRVQTYDALRIDGACSNVLIQNLQFRGRKSDFIVWPYNADDLRVQQAAIADRSIPSTSSHITIRSVNFKQLYSHCVRTGHAGEQHWSILDCRVDQCTNGMNCNADDVLYQGGHVISANGIETVGQRASVLGVTLQDGTGINCGGSGEQVAGVQVIGNNLKNITTGGAAIGFAGCTRGIIDSNYIDSCASGMHGIALGDTDAFAIPSGPNIVRGNSVKNLTGNHGIWCHTASGSIISDNYSEAAIDALLIQCDGVVVKGNRLSGVGQDLEISNTTNLRFDVTNILVNSRFISGGTLTGAIIEWKGTGVPAVALPNGSTFVRTDGAAGTTFYVRVSGAWVGVA